MSQRIRLGVIAFTFSTAIYAATVSVVPSVSNVNPGQIFSVSLSGADFAPTPLDAGGLDITWDPTILTLGPAGFTLGPAWNASSTTGTAGAGSLSDIFFFADTAQGPNVDIGTLELQALVGGMSAVTLAESGLNPFAGGGGPLAVDLSNGTVNVSQIPEPATAAVVSGALLALFASRRFFANKRTHS